MKEFDHILSWKLLSGSHDFPGLDGGTCINEAAIVAAGMTYKAVESVDDCPPCFSRPIAAYAIGLNDYMPDDIRNKLLLPFVIRLAGTASSKEVETARSNFIAIETVRQILPPVLRGIGLTSHAEACSLAKDRNAHAARAAAHAADAAAHAAARTAHYDAAARAAAAAARAAAHAAHAAARAAHYDAAARAAHYAAAAHAAHAAHYDAAAETIWGIAVDILDRAILMGNHTSIDTQIAIERLTVAKQLAEVKS